MIILIKYDRKIVSFNNYITTFNTDILKFKDAFEDIGISTFLIYRKNSPNKVKTNKRNFKSLNEIDIRLIKEDCILFFHTDIIDSSDPESIFQLINQCEADKKILVIQFSEFTEHLFRGSSFESYVEIDSNNIEQDLINLQRELKIKRLLT